MAKSFEERFYPRIQISEGCWNWIGGKDSRGYGRYSSDLRAHQAAYLKLVGEIPVGMCVCHKCDNPLCANPDHLFLGTKIDNNKDRHKKGRTSKASRNVGAMNPGAKISEQNAESIRALRADGAPLKKIAEIYGISQAMVSLIARGKRWGVCHR